MALDHRLACGPTPSWAPPPLFQSSAAAAAPGEDAAAVGKVKFICSLGGRILPRPSDGALRYVGGHTRIISVRRDASFPELMAKMAEAFGGPVALKYQLPDEDLDALVSVSSPEDLDNMMDEYDKLAEDAADGSAKLRAFLFPPSDDADLLADAHDDSGQRYVDAVNGLAPPGDPASFKRKDSGTLSSPQASDCPSAAETGSATGGTSPTTLAPPDAPRLVSDPPPHALNRVPVASAQPLGISGGASPISTTIISSQPYVPVHPYVAPAATQINTSVKPIHLRPELYREENQAVGKAAHLPSDSSYKTYQQPLSQLPPLPPLHLQPQSVERYDVRQVPPPMPQEQQQGEDCYMCEKALPHAHSDTLVKETGSGLASSVLEVNPVFYSHHSEDAMRQRGQHGVVNATMVGNVVEPQIESVVPTGLLRTHGIAPVPDAQYGGDMQAMTKAETLDNAKVLLPPGTMGVMGDVATSYGMFPSNLLQPHIAVSFQQQEPVRQNLVPPQYPAESDLVAKPVSADVSSGINANVLAAEQVLGFSYEYVSPIDAITESSRISPHEIPRFDDQGNPVIRLNVSTSKDLKPGRSPMVVENGSLSTPQVGGNPFYVNNASNNSGIVSEGNSVKPVAQQLPPAYLHVSHLHNNQMADFSHTSTMTGTPRPYAYDLQKGLEPPVPNERLLGMPTYSRGFDPSWNHDIVNKIPMEDWKNDASQFQCKNVPNPIAPPLSSNLLPPSFDTNSPTERNQIFQKPLPSDSLFSNQDPWKIVGGPNLLPPKPNRAASEESVISEESGINNHLVQRNGSDLLTVLEEGGFPQPNSLDKIVAEKVEPTKGLAEEKIKQDLQAVAEGIAASVLQSPTPCVPVFYAHERKESAAEPNKESRIIEENLGSQSAAAIIDQKIEDIRVKQFEKVNLGFPITDDIGRLQIIKSSDLEELRELGSGTFGTVYHGKWRGTDVAIKRINDRCFAGKPSEQERMRSDFWNEACKLADLHHPNVVAFYGVVVDGPGGSIATVTEFMVNGSLRHALQRNDRTLDRRKRLLIAMDVAFGMEYLHGKNIVHFDLKSDNLLVNLRDPQRPICKVGDLGLSRVKCRTLISGGVRGTLPWMAPELLNGSSSLVSEKVDVFSFGIVMWELITGEEPYANLHYGVIIGGIVSNTLRPPVPESCDPKWRSLMEQCWSSEPAERPSFTEIAGRLRAMAAALPQKSSAAAAHQAAQSHPQK